jgi:hypothetical protein
MSPEESNPWDCAVITGVSVWRSGHIGILAQDAEAQLMLVDVLVAESHIGINLNFFKTYENMFTAVIGSTIIGSLNIHEYGHCNDLTDSAYYRSKQCQAFTQFDPFGLSKSCRSVVSDMYRRVGIMVSQWTNKARTCVIDGTTAQCIPPVTPERLCSLPFEKRFGLPMDIAYAEQLIYDTSFYGFTSKVFANSSGITGQCIPGELNDRSVAISINPSQIDWQPNIIMSGLGFIDTDQRSRLGLDPGKGEFYYACLNMKPCDGHNVILLHDLDGSVNPTKVPGHMAYNNPAYVAPYPYCFEVPELIEVAPGHQLACHFPITESLGTTLITGPNPGLTAQPDNAPDSPNAAATEAVFEAGAEPWAQRQS